MSDDYVKVSLDTIGGGAAVGRFNDALQDVLENIFDPNVQRDKKREIHLVVKMFPTKDDPQKIHYEIHVKKKLSPPLAVDNVIYAGADRREGLVAYEQDIRQLVTGTIMKRS